MIMIMIMYGWKKQSTNTRSSSDDDEHNKQLIVSFYFLFYFYFLLPFLLKFGAFVSLSCLYVVSTWFLCVRECVCSLFQTQTAARAFPF